MTDDDRRPGRHGRSERAGPAERDGHGGRGARFAFNGLGAGEAFATVVRPATGLELCPVWAAGAGAVPEIEVTSTDAAEGWSVYLRLVSDEARVLHDAQNLREAARALVAAGGVHGFPAALEAWDMHCAAGSVRALPAALRAELARSVAFRLRDGHAAFALAAWIDLALHEAACDSGSR